MIEKIDRYEIHEQLGQGGMAQVYRGYDPHFERYVAVKVLHGHLLTDPESENRFTREARTIAQLEGDAIVPVYDFGRFENTAFIVMRLMKGGTLQEKMTGSPLPMEFINQVIRRICSALERAHSHQVIHRDLKPANILFDDDGMSYLADFGIARMTEGTQTTSIIGTANYMAPEQAQGKPLDGRTDIYQLAVILFEMLTGHQPYEGETTASVLYQHVYEPIPRLISYAGVQNSRFQVLIDNAMAKEMEQRPVSANEFFDLFKMAAAEIDNLQPGAATLVDPLVTRQQPFRETLDDPTVADPPTEKMLISPPELTTADPVFSDRSPAPAVGRPTWVVPAIGGAALLLLIIGWWVIGLPTFPGAGRPPPNPTQLVVVVTQVVSDQGATEPEISLIPPPVEPQNDPSPTLTVLPTATPSPTATPPPALSNLLGGGTEIIAYAANDGDNYDIFVQPINGDIPTRLTTDRANDFGPVWSPDGREIAFHTFRDGNWEIYIMDTSGRSKRNLTRASGDDAFAAWAPDGQTLAFHSNRGGDFEIYLIGRDGSNLIQITDNEIDDFGPHWSPDGQKIAYHRRTTQGRQIFVMNRDGSGIQQLTTGPTEHIFPLWSPDGNFLLYQDVVDEDRSRLYLMNPDGSDPQPITPRHQPAFFPSWSPDGLWILYHALEDAGSNREIYMIARTGGEPQRITTTAAVERMPVWQPVER